jgi:mannosyltransferase OCH1-like enzyme
MGSIPRHPFFLKVIDALPRYDRSWVLPYITVMGSTGPLFLSVIWRHYNMAGPVAEEGRVRVLFPDEYIKHSWSFFRYHLGNSWHQKDVEVIFWMSRHWMLLTAAGFLVAGLVFTSLWWVYGRMLLSGSPKGQQFRRRLPFWRRFSAKKDDDATSQYELLRRYDEDRLEA